MKHQWFGNIIFISVNNTSYNIFPLGDSAITVDFGNIIDIALNKKIIGLFHLAQQSQITGVSDIVPAYSSLTLHYKMAEVKKQYPGASAFETIKRKLCELLDSEQEISRQTIRKIRLPVCYDDAFALDKKEMMTLTGLSFEEIIRLHTSQRYTVFMLGFLPGFAYLGEVDNRIAAPRKEAPRTSVPQGSVGIAGRQTGVYPATSPGGWQIIGRTPVQLFDAEKEEPCLLKAGDEVQFYSIGEDEFNHT